MMLRSYRNARVICQLIINQISKRYQSVDNVALEPNLSKISIFNGHIKGDITNQLEIIRPEKHIPIPMYQVLDSEGHINDINNKPDVSNLIQLKSIQKNLEVQIFNDCFSLI